MKILKTIQSRKTNRVFWQEIANVDFNKSEVLLDNFVKVDTNKKFQKIMGFGGSFSQSSGYVLSILDKKDYEKLIKAYYSEEGLNYNLGRVHINSCDFSLNNYTYVKENDEDLSTFDISVENKYVIPMIKKAYEVSDNNIRLLASPWSPPAYMKDNKNMNYGGKLLDKYQPLWAKYYAYYILKMKEQGIKINAISVQNEPAATQTWDSCIYSAYEEKEFVKNHLGPTLKNFNLDDVHIYVWDHNRGDILVNRALTYFEDKQASKYIYGLAFHWYCSEDFASLSKFHELYPDKALLFSEGCVEYGVYGDESKLRWENGEHYAHHLINDLNNYSQGFIDWNLFLDENGGPNHVNNFCEAPIMVNQKTKQIIYNVSYYYIGHFSKYIKENATRLLTIAQSNNNVVEACSFENENNEIVVIILNRGYIENVTLIIDDERVNLSLPNQSITTFIIDKKGENNE